MEDSIPTFESFCQHDDGPSLAASQEYLRHFEAVASMYAGLATKSTASIKETVSASVLLRWRTVGLQAMRCIASSRALSLEGGKVLKILMPVILDHLYADEADYLKRLQQRAQSERHAENEKEMKRRMSTATARTVETIIPDISIPQAMADVDESAEERIGLLALESLEEIFTVSSRGQIRASTSAVLEYVLGRTSRVFNQPNEKAGIDSITAWAATLIEVLALWAPVQDRFLILVTAMDTLAKRPVVEEDFQQQWVLATLIDWLLRSEANLIGLSIMDVLLDLIKRLLGVLELGKSSTGVQTSFQRAASKWKVNIREELLSTLRRCIADLATHVYYSDQISDMLSAILLRMKPTPLSVAGSTVAGRATSLPTQMRPASAVFHESPGSGDFFSSDAAKVIALKAIKEILLIANNKTPGSVAGTSSRNRVGVDIWDGSQWLLREQDGHVRKAYVDSMLTWLRFEVGKGDPRIWEEKEIGWKSITRVGREHSGGMAHTQRLSPNHSHRQSLKPPKPRFMTLLHLAIYENAMERLHSESDLQLLHVLLTGLTEKLGVTAVKSGLSMIFQLQEEIQSIKSPMARIRLGSLTHGYFWVLSERFDLGCTIVGSEIQNEINRRKSKRMWMESIQYPAIGIEHIRTPGITPISEELAQDNIQSESLEPFNRRDAMVDLIVSSYTASLLSPPGSPPSSPSRNHSKPILSMTLPVSSIPASSQLESELREDLLSEWNKEAITATYRKENSNSVSINGSRRGVTPAMMMVRNISMINGMNGGTVGSSNGGGSHSPHYGGHHPRHLHHHHHHHGRNPPSPPPGGIHTGNGLGTVRQKLRHVSSVREGGSSTPQSDSSRSSVIRVDELKRVLSGNMKSTTGSTDGRRDFWGPNSSRGSSSSSESLVSGDLSTSDVEGDDGKGVDATDFAVDVGGPYPVSVPVPGSEPQAKDIPDTKTNGQPKELDLSSSSTEQATAPLEESESTANQQDTTIPLPLSSSSPAITTSLVPPSSSSSSSNNNRNNLSPATRTAASNLTKSRSQSLQRKNRASTGTLRKHHHHHHHAHEHEPEHDHLSLENPSKVDLVSILERIRTIEDEVGSVDEKEKMTMVVEGKGKGKRKEGMSGEMGAVEGRGRVGLGEIPVSRTHTFYP